MILNTPFYKSAATDDVTAVGQNFSASKFHEHTLSTAPTEQIDTQGAFKGRIETIIVRMTGLASGNTTVTVKGTWDEAGDDIWFPDTDGTIATGITTTSTGSGVFEFKLPVQPDTESDKAYLFFKVNGSTTVTVDASYIFWSN